MGTTIVDVTIITTTTTIAATTTTSSIVGTIIIIIIGATIIGAITIIIGGTIITPELSDEEVFSGRSRSVMPPAVLAARAHLACSLFSHQLP